MLFLSIDFIKKKKLRCHYFKKYLRKNIYVRFWLTNKNMQLFYLIYINVYLYKFKNKNVDTITNIY